jgi:branched-chain amino acid transport system substrate-binding protein
MIKSSASPLESSGLTRRTALVAAGSLALAGRSRRVQARAAKPDQLTMGISTFLSGAPSVFGIPGQKTADMLVAGINAAGGIHGVKLRPIYIDEGPGVEHFTGEYRRLVQNEGAQIMLTSISSANCLACAPLADEMKRPTLLWDCGTPRVFEDGRYTYAFRTQANGTPEILAPLLYLLKKKPDFRTVAVINQDYAWGRDSWDVFRTALQALKPDARVVAELFPRFGATDFSTEITRLLALRPDVILSTSWGGELDILIKQAAERKLFDRSLFVLPLAQSSVERVGSALPSGHIVGCRGDHWFLHPQPRDPAVLAKFNDDVRKATGAWPIYPCFHMAQAFSAMQKAYDKAIAAKGGGWPTDAELAHAFELLEFDSPTATVRIREDHQGLENQLVGTSLHVDKYDFAVLTDMVIFKPDTITTPAGQKSTDWLKTLKPDLVASVPAPIPYH